MPTLALLHLLALGRRLRWQRVFGGRRGDNWTEKTAFVPRKKTPMLAPPERGSSVEEHGRVPCEYLSARPSHPCSSPGTRTERQAMMGQWFLFLSSGVLWRRSKFSLLLLGVGVDDLFGDESSRQRAKMRRGLMQASQAGLGGREASFPALLQSAVRRGGRKEPGRYSGCGQRRKRQKMMVVVGGRGATRDCAELGG
jgi:hypothetical protein